MGREGMGAGGEGHHQRGGHHCHHPATTSSSVNLLRSVSPHLSYQGSSLEGCVLSIVCLYICGTIEGRVGGGLGRGLR